MKLLAVQFCLATFSVLFIMPRHGGMVCVDEKQICWIIARWGEVAVFGGAVDGSRGCELLGHGASGRFWGGLLALLGRSGSFEGG